METIPTALRVIVDSNPLLQLGLREGILNLSQTARYITPQVRARTKKKIQPAAVIMGLSRLQRSLSASESKSEQNFTLKNLSVQSGLAVVTYPKNADIHRAVNAAYAKVRSGSRFMSITEGSSEITVIVESQSEKAFRDSVDAKPLTVRKGVASVTVKFDERYIDAPGFLCFVLLQLYFQNINVIELASTSSELIVYIDDQDVQLAFDTIYNRFVREK